MEFICFDVDKTSPWHYEAETKMYYRNFVDGKHEGKIAGEHIPNPELLLKQRLETVMMIQGKVTGEDRNRNKPSATTYDLYKHWQEASK